MSDLVTKLKDSCVIYSPNRREGANDITTALIEYVKAAEALWRLKPSAAFEHRRIALDTYSAAEAALLAALEGRHE